MSDPSPWYRDLTIGDRAEGRRLDAYLAARFEGWSRTLLAKWIRRGGVQSDARPLKPSSRLRLGERIRIHIPGLAPTEPPPPLPAVLHEDARVLVLDKPPGLLCHPSGHRWAYAVIGLARRARPDHSVELVHRLDRDTSGVLVLTKDKAANVFLKEAVRSRHVHKVYLAIARGLIPWDATDVHAPIGDAADSEIRLRRGVNPDGKQAHTSVRVLRRIPLDPNQSQAPQRDGCTLIELILHTGRTHQIRIHMDHLGFPLLGDKIYGQPDSTFLHFLDFGDDDVVRRAVGFPRQALHCATMTFPHPDHGTVTVHAPLAADLKAILDGAQPGRLDPSHSEGEP
ncbi:MAG: RluA family pseudouridine synthase [Oligoflexia bacterium]|nr:RluA family pseudouridine synthase [Oligoflexia bacterium]